MSLPPAPKDTSTHPAKGAVIDPVDKDAKDRDVDRKLTLYTALLALRSSKLPTNAQLDAYLSYWKGLQDSSSDPKTSQLSKEGQKLVRDVQDILETLRSMVKEKNRDEIIQEFVWGTRALGDDVTASAEATTKDAKAPVTQEKAKEDGQVAIKHLRTLLTLLLTNSEARKLVSDFGLVGRDLLSKTLVKAAEGVAPNEERLRGVDEPHRGSQEFVDKEELKRRKEEAKEKIEAAKQTKDQKKEEAANAALDEINTAQARAEADGAEAAANEVTSPTKKKGFMERITGGVKDTIPGEHQDKAKAHYSRGKEFITEEYFPESRRDQWIWRGKKVIIECQKHPEYQESLEWLISFIKEYATHGRSFSQTQLDNSKSNAPSSLNTSLHQLKVIIERFASNKSFNNLILDPINALIDDAKRDPELETWWKEVGVYMERCVREPGYVTEPQCEAEGRKLEDTGKIFFGGEVRSDLKGGETEARERGKYREHLDRVFDGAREFVGGVAEDRTNKRLGTDIQRLTKDLLFENDHLKFKSDLWNDVRGVILPSLIDEVGYIPIPRIEYTDETFDLVVENLTLSGRNLFPNVVEVEMHNWLRWETFDKLNNPKDPHNTTTKNSKRPPNSHHKFHMHMTQIQADMRDVLFYFNKKGGAIKIKDSGVADLVLGGEGMSVDVELGDSRDEARLFDIKKVAVKIEGSLKVSIRDSKHDVLYKTLKPLMMGLVKRQVQKAVESGIRSGFEFISEELIAVKQRMDEAQRAAEAGEGEEAVGRLQALQDAFKRTPSISAQSKDAVSVQSAGGGSQFKVVANKRNSILGEVGHSGGWVSRVGEREKLIGRASTSQPGAGVEDKGDREKAALAGTSHAPGSETWKSEVFDLRLNTQAKA
ncbi:hypothetical protein PQX77_019418 [Marasmius sp. AFHP31]|nr:hypothetical protein PQX77_019418 [Marasmius sp. AFHP31]